MDLSLTLLPHTHALHCRPSLAKDSGERMLLDYGDIFFTFCFAVEFMIKVAAPYLEILKS